MPCHYDGYVIGDVVLCYLAKESFNLIGRPAVHNWVQFHAETGAGRHNVKFERDERSASRANPIARKTYRFQVQGPNAMKVMTKVLGKAPPELKFFNMVDDGDRRQAACSALRHGMAGQPGFELFGPAADGQAVLDAILEAGKEFGLRLVGSRAYSSNTLESGWIPSPDAAGVFGRRAHEEVPRMAAGERLRGQCLARRQLRLGQHRRLLHDAL